MKTAQARLGELESRLDDLIQEMSDAIIERVVSAHGRSGARRMLEALLVAQAEEKTHLIEMVPDDMRSTIEAVNTEFEGRLWPR